MLKDKTKRNNTLTLTLSIALLPPIWAVLSPCIGVTTGAVALICAGVYVANGNKRQDALRMLVGFLAGDVWAILATYAMGWLPFAQGVNVFLTLCVMGAIAVIVGESFPKVFYTPSWLCGWAIGLTVFSLAPQVEMLSLAAQVAAAMAAGVLYVGIGVDAFQKWLLQLLDKNNKT